MTPIHTAATWRAWRNPALRQQFIDKCRLDFSDPTTYATPSEMYHIQKEHQQLVYLDNIKSSHDYLVKCEEQKAHYWLEHIRHEQDLIAQVIEILTTGRTKEHLAYARVWREAINHYPTRRLPANLDIYFNINDTCAPTYHLKFNYRHASWYLYFRDERIGAYFPIHRVPDLVARHETKLLIAPNLAA